MYSDSNTDQDSSSALLQKRHTPPLLKDDVLENIRAILKQKIPDTIKTLNISKSRGTEVFPWMFNKNLKEELTPVLHNLFIYVI